MKKEAGNDKSSLMVLGLMLMAASAPGASMADALNGASGFFGVFCNAVNFFSGRSPLVAFIALAGGFGLLAALMMGEDRGFLTSIVKWLAGGAGLIGLTGLITTIFGNVGLSCL